MGTHVETAGGDTSSIQNSQSVVANAVKGIHLHDFAAPIHAGESGMTYMSLTFLSSNACSSTTIGSGTTDLIHPICELVYHYLKCELLSQAFIARAGLQNCIRVVNASYLPC